MITCIPGGDAKTNRITRGCLILAILIIGAIGVCAVSVAAVDAQACQRSLITPANEFANVRAEPNTTSAIKRQLLAGQSAEATGPANGWYTLTAGGYMSAAVVTATCLTPATPTRIPSSTPPSLEVKQFHFICPKACEVTIDIEELP